MATKTEDEVEKMRRAITTKTAPCPDYWQGVEDALLWVQGDLSDNELLTGEEDE